MKQPENMLRYRGLSAVFAVSRFLAALSCYYIGLIFDHGVFPLLTVFVAPYVIPSSSWARCFAGRAGGMVCCLVGLSSACFARHLVVAWSYDDCKKERNRI